MFLTSTQDGGEWSALCRLLYSWGVSSQYPLARRLGGPQSQSGHGGEGKIYDPAGN